VQIDLDSIRTWAELKHYYSEIEWIIPEWLPKGYVTMLAADPGVGKSLLALSLCKIVLSGGRFYNGYYIPEPAKTPMKRILWVEAEAGEPFHMQRASKLGINPLQIIEPRSSALEPSTPSLNSKEDRDLISAILRHPDVSMAVLDSLSAASSGIDENSSQSAIHVKWLSELARDCNKPILVVHHMNKSTLRSRGSAIPTLADIRGSSALLQHARIIWTLDNPKPDDPSIIRLACAKSNLGKRPESILLENSDGRIDNFTATLQSVGSKYLQ
jgi:RecA-family ATPase